MFYIFCTQLYELGFSSGTWNYFEAGHGKGAPDGVGGALKRSADAVVASGMDIPDAASFYRLLLDKTTIKLYFVPESSVREAIQAAPDDIASVCGTMTIHQLVTIKRGEFIHRPISCVCSPELNYNCDCFNAKLHVYQVVFQSTTVAIDSSAETTVVTGSDELELPLQISSAVEDWSNPALIGQYCCVEYDGKAYPGIIKNNDESDVEVQCMHAVGENRFFWPEKQVDICWYPVARMLALIPEPRNVTSRHKEVEPAVWAAVLKKLNDLSS